eukprot:gene20099-26096_t
MIGCPVKDNNNNNNIKNSECPIKDNTNLEYDSSINDLKYNQNIQPNQSKPLSTVRAVSTIPKSEYSPLHQPSNIDRWVYPSEQQYYNAMRRKGYNPNESDVPAILYIHNMVNEEGWRRIKDWESLRGNSKPLLYKFQGRPKDLSPKAFLMHYILGYSLPFDRHDWYINRNGKEIRYVIDFYRGSRAGIQTPVSIHLDVRPAIDSFSSIVDLSYYYYRKTFSPWTLPHNTK